MKFFKKFDNHSDYSKYIKSSDAFFPNLSICKPVFDGEIEHVHYNMEREPQTFEMVDLGLPSGTKWATCNLGATKPEEYGDYYMWGSVTPNNKNICDWTHAPFNNGRSDYNSAYFTSVSGDVCPGGVLANEYDAAYVATGGKCHMPRYSQINELTANTTNEWTTENGVRGRKFTSKTDATKYIFIPASGYRFDSSFIDQGSNGYLWSSILYSSRPYTAWYLNFSSSYCGMDYRNRYYGFSVRPVSE